MRDAAHSRFLESKRIRHFVFSQKFEKAMELASEDDKKTLEELIKLGSIKEIRKYVDKILAPEVKHASLTQLRHMAKQFGIRYYYYMTRNQLIESIENEKKRFANSNAGISCKSEVGYDCKVRCRPEQTGLHDLESY